MVDTIGEFTGQDLPILSDRRDGITNNRTQEITERKENVRVGNSQHWSHLESQEKRIADGGD
jgi:cell division septum initiation protein DivIVA